MQQDKRTDLTSPDDKLVQFQKQGLKRAGLGLLPAAAQQPGLQLSVADQSLRSQKRTAEVDVTV